MEGRLLLPIYEAVWLRSRWGYDELEFACGGNLPRQAGPGMPSSSFRSPAPREGSGHHLHLFLLHSAEEEKKRKIPAA